MSKNNRSKFQWSIKSKYANNDSRCKEIDMYLGGKYESNLIEEGYQEARKLEQNKEYANDELVQDSIKKINNDGAFKTFINMAVDKPSNLIYYLSESFANGYGVKPNSNINAYFAKVTAVTGDKLGVPECTQLLQTKYNNITRDIINTAEVIVKEAQENQKVLNNVTDLQWGEAIAAGYILDAKIKQACNKSILDCIIIDNDNSCPQAEYSQYIEAVNQVGEVNDTPPNSECCVIL